MLRKGRIKKEEYDGTKDYHWYWEIEEWNTGQPVDSGAFSGGRSSGSAAASRPNGSGGTEPDDRFRTKEELRLTAAYTIAASMAGPMGYKDINDVTDAAEAIYTNLGAINVPPDVPEEAPQGRILSATDDPFYQPLCQSHEVYYNHEQHCDGQEVPLCGRPQ